LPGHAPTSTKRRLRHRCAADEYCRLGLRLPSRPGAGRHHFVNPDTDPAACGPTAVACTGLTPRCEAGVCVAQCSGAFDTCGNACINPDTDPEHCGGCDVRCSNDEVCVQGNCEQFDTAVGCNACPCATCGGGDACCDYPGSTAQRICVDGGGACPVAP
jgi:hypothetical protein